MERTAEELSDQGQTVASQSSEVSNRRLAMGAMAAGAAGLAAGTFVAPKTSEAAAQATLASLQRQLNKQQTEILADAARQAGQIRGQGDASASEVYARSYSKNAEFYSFYRSMQSYRQAVGTQGDVLVIAPDSSYFKYFNKSQPQPLSR